MTDFFPTMDTPPRQREGQPDVLDLLHPLLKGIVESMEKNANDEETRLGAGITLRAIEMDSIIDNLRKYALVARGKLPVEALVEVRNLLDKMLTEANAVIEKYPIPEKEKTEI